MSTKRGILAMSSLGRNGRFGNQVFQYAFLRHYAEKHNLEVRTPDWIGQWLFEHHEDSCEGLHLPLLYDQTGDFTILDKLQHPVVNVDVCGYFQYHTRYYCGWQQQFRHLFLPREDVRKPLEHAVNRLRAGDRTIIGVHVRRGDFSGGIHFAAPVQWYLQWLKQNWPSWKNPLLYVATDDPKSVLPSFSEFQYVTEKDLTVEVPQAPFYPDYFALTQCDALAVSNSSFSFSAAMLNTRGKAFARPSLRAASLIPFDPWDADPVMAEAARDEQAAFYERIYVETAGIFAALDKSPEDRQLQSQLRAKRRFLSDLWLGMNDDTLRVVYNTHLAKAQRLLLSGLARDLPRTPDESKYIQSILRELSRGLQAVWSTQYLLAAMLYCPAEELPMAHDLAHLPQWLLSDYIEYLRTPRVSGQAAAKHA